MEQVYKDNLRSRGRLPKELKDEIIIKGTVTGSYIFGGYVPGESDIDFILMLDYKLWDDLYPYAILSSSSITEQDRYQSMYVQTDTDFINLIFVSQQEDFDNWMKAHKLMIQLCATNQFYKKMIQTKRFRVDQFEAMRSYFDGYKHWDYEPEKAHEDGIF